MSTAAFSYLDDYYGSILDPLHGQIKLSEIEKWIISHPLYSRLRRIKQNTFLYYVFPSANHTRFEHSLGVMHLASEIFKNCKRNYATGIKKLEKYEMGEKSNSLFFDLASGLDEDEPVLYQELRLAGLLHDIGHGPMSHLFDRFAISKEQFLGITSTDEVLKEYTEHISSLIGSSSRIEHEVMSCTFIVYIINQLKKLNAENEKKFSSSAKEIIQKIDIWRIIKMIEPGIKTNGIIINNKDYTDFFSKIISGFPIDADRMDYLLRDSYFSGVKYGIYDITRVFASFVAKENENTVFLTVKESGVDSIIRFIQSRTHLFNQVYFHKTNRAANSMLDMACRKISSSAFWTSTGSFSDLIEFYLSNGDDHFLFHFLKSKIADVEENEILKELLNRKLYKRVFETKIVKKGTDRMCESCLKDVIERMKNKSAGLEMEGIYASIDSYKNISFKDSEKQIKIAQKQGENYNLVNDWENYSPEISSLNINVYMIRIYLRRKFNSSQEFKDCKTKILSYFKDEIEELKALNQTEDYTQFSQKA